jgi:regulator of replication initiation timing
MMPDIITSMTTAVSLLSRLKKIGENIKDAEFKNAVADLTLEMADLKMKIAALVEENTQLQTRVKELENQEGEPCPKCRQRTWELVSSKPNQEFDFAGVLDRIYKCSSCEFSETHMYDPKNR